MKGFWGKVLKELPGSFWLHIIKYRRRKIIQRKDCLIQKSQELPVKKMPCLSRWQQMLRNDFWAQIKFGALPGKQSECETKYVVVKSSVKISERSNMVSQGTTQTPKRTSKECKDVSHRSFQLNSRASKGVSRLLAVSAEARSRNWLTSNKSVYVSFA